MSEVFYGHVYSKGHKKGPTPLDGTEGLIRFIEQFLFSEELRITDSSEHLILHVLDSVKVFSSLHEFGVDLTQIHNELQGKLLIENEDETGYWDEWDGQFDNIGLSPLEIKTRQAVIKACKSARTVADVAELVKENCITAFFESEDGSQAWGDFNAEDYSVVSMGEPADNEKSDKYERFFLKPDARVRHDASGDEILVFILLDPLSD